MTTINEFRERGFTYQGENDVTEREPTDEEIMALMECPFCIQHDKSGLHQIGCMATGLRFPVEAGNGGSA